MPDPSGNASPATQGSADEARGSPTRCFDDEPVAPENPETDVGLAANDLPDAERWRSAPCVDEAVLGPAIETYRDHNRRIATDALQTRGLTPVRLPQAMSPGGPLIAIDTVVETDEGQLIAATPAALFARDRCGVLHRLRVHHEAASALSRTANVCGCFAGGYGPRAVEGWWLEPQEISVPEPNGGALMEPEPRQNHLYVLPEGVETGDALVVTIHRAYRLLARGRDPGGGPCLPPP